MMQGFRARLKQRQERVNSLLCVGLDPSLEKVPQSVLSAFGYMSYRDIHPNDSEGMVAGSWMRSVVHKTAPYASMFKLQSAHWEALRGGRAELQSTIAYIYGQYPDIPVLEDVKRGDIGRTQEKL